MTGKASKWILPFNPTPGASLQLFCFPYTGVGASVYRTWAAELGPAIEVIGVQPPGREARFAEPLFTRLDPLLDALLPAIQPLLSPPFAFFGHSLGSFVSFELCRRLRAAGGPLPVHLFVSGQRAAQSTLRKERYHLLPDAELIEQLRRYNGTPAPVLADKELMDLLLPILRADFAIHELYSYAEGPPLDLPITAFGGIGDESIPEAELDAWRKQTARAFRLQMFPGDHFYLNEARGALTRSIAADLRRALAEEAAPAAPRPK